MPKTDFSIGVMQTLNLEPLLGNDNSVGKLAEIPKGNRGAKTFGSFSYENKEENSQFASSHFSIMHKITDGKVTLVSDLGQSHGFCL